MSALLAFDTATEEVVVGVARDGGLVEESRVGPAEDGMPRHATVLLGEVERLVGTVGGWDEIERIGVGVGPGSYTGIRIGVASARALGQSLRKPVVALGTLEALAHGIGQAAEAATHERLAVLDARRGQAFALLAGFDGEVLWGPEVLSPEALCARATAAQMPLAAGSGALRFRNELEAAGIAVLPGGSRAHRISPEHVCELASRGRAAQLKEVAPVYLRPPDAELWLK